MEGLPSGDIQTKYQKLASEYSKVIVIAICSLWNTVGNLCNLLFPLLQLRVHVKVLKKGVLDEQAKSNEFREALKEKEKCLRKGELEIDSLTFRNQQLTRRVSVLQDELESLQVSIYLYIKQSLVKLAVFAYSLYFLCLLLSVCKHLSCFLT